MSLEFYRVLVCLFISTDSFHEDFMLPLYRIIATCLFFGNKQIMHNKVDRYESFY